MRTVDGAGRAVNTSRPSLVSSLSTIPEIINVLILLRRERERGRERGFLTWKAGRNDTCDTVEYVYTEENFRNVWLIKFQVLCV